MSRIRKTPEKAGETPFADIARAHDALHRGIKDQIEQLEYKASFYLQFRDETRPGSLWKSVRTATEEGYPPNAELAAASGEVAKLDFPPAVHPVVACHPESDRTCNRTATQGPHSPGHPLSHGSSRQRHAHVQDRFKLLRRQLIAQVTQLVR